MKITGSATDARYRAVFDWLFARGREAVLASTHHRDTPPVDGGRWGPSVVFVPDTDLRGRLGEITAGAMDIAGAGHWPTGAAHAVHVTVGRSRRTTAGPTIRYCREPRRP